MQSDKRKNLRGFSKAANTFEEFVRSQSFGGVVLIVCTIIALAWANSDSSALYFHLNHIKMGFDLGLFSIHKSLQHWINDGLMAIFFLLVGLEIKREVLAGELSCPKKAALPIFAAIGGMVAPAAIYLILNHGNKTASLGWAIPTATDIAFAIGILSLFGKRIPRSLILLLSAIAIVDDIGAITIIATFYTNTISLYFMLLAGLFFALLLCFNKMGVRRLIPYLVVGAMMWCCLEQSGVHATIAGVLLAFTVPGRSIYKSKSLTNKLNALILKFDKANGEDKSIDAMENEQRKDILQTIEDLVYEVETPLQRLEHALNIPVTFIIIPLFVLFNAGVYISAANIGLAFHNPIGLGIILGLVLGKIIGIFGVSLLLVACKIVKLPSDIKLIHLLPLSMVAGIGFTMSIFISELAFGSSESAIMTAKLAILCASLIAAFLSYVTILLISKGNKKF